MQGLDTTSPSGRLLFSLLSVFSDYERAMIRSRGVAGLDRVCAQKRLGRPPMPADRVETINAMLLAG
ncbi:recombinase family protein [Microvirga sp. 17 mud 1-3]|uniref:recombinase family protein n=1 Tax=Microvirga sp. 17 mud 1-3 TaxID=2082949 RepID=UPI00352F8290